MRKNNSGNNSSGNNRNNKNPEKCDNSNMESSFYEDNTTQFSSNNNNNNNNNNNGSASSNNNNNMKRLLSLDLNAKAPAKKQRLNQTAASGASTNTPNPLVLDSPDFQVLKFNTPDIEKFILANTSLQTPTQNLVFPTKVTVTSEQEDYVKGFEEALNSLHNSENSQKLSINASANALVGGMSGGSVTYTNLDEMPVAIKDEPQTVPNSPPLSPIDMEDQERIKLERKRQRNRVAASKCRKRKLERISKLEDKVKSLKGENSELASLIKKLKEHVCLLKQQVMEHVHAGCTLISTSNLLQVK